MNVSELVREDKIIESLADTNYVFEQRITGRILKKTLQNFWYYPASEGSVRSFNFAYK